MRMADLTREELLSDGEEEIEKRENELTGENMLVLKHAILKIYKSSSKHITSSLPLSYYKHLRIHRVALFKAY